MMYRQRVESDIALLSSNTSTSPARPTHRIISNTYVSAATALKASSGTDVELTLASTLSSHLPPTPNPARYNLVFLGTGYHRPPSAFSFLRGLAPRLPALQTFLQTGDTGEGLVDRDYALAPAPAREDDWRVRVFLLGLNERSHGLSDSLLSVGAVRAGEVVRALTGLAPERTK